MRAGAGPAEACGAAGPAPVGWIPDGCMDHDYEQQVETEATNAAETSVPPWRADKRAPL